MSAEKPAFAVVEPDGGNRRPVPLGVDLSHSSIRPRDFRLTGAGRKAKDLIGLLMSHGSRIRRAARPRCRIVLDVVTPGGHRAVDICCD